MPQYTIQKDKTNITFFKEKLQNIFDIKASLLSTGVYFFLKTLREIYLFRNNFFELMMNYFSVTDDQ